MMRKYQKLLNFCFVGFITIITSCTATIIETNPKIPVEKFTLIVLEFTIQQCSPMAEQCRDITGRGGGSGVLIAKNESESAIFTAGHNCEGKVGDTDLDMSTGLPIINTITKLETTIRDYEGETYNVISRIIDSKIDLCIITVDELIPYDPIHVSNKAPEVGEKFWNIAAPDSVWSPRAPLIFEGIYSGEWEVGEVEGRNADLREMEVDRAAYTIPTYTGSSGSPILNQDFELVGILLARPPNRPIHVGFSATYEQVRKFLNDNLSEHIVEGNE